MVPVNERGSHVSNTTCHGQFHTPWQGDKDGGYPKAEEEPSKALPRFGAASPASRMTCLECELQKGRVVETNLVGLRSSPERRLRRLGHLKPFETPLTRCR